MNPITEIEVPIVETVKPTRKMKVGAGGLRYAAVLGGNIYGLFWTVSGANTHIQHHLSLSAYVLDIVTGEKVRHG